MTEDHDAEMELIEVEPGARKGRASVWWTATVGVLAVLIVVVVVVVTRAGDDGDADGADPAGEGGEDPATVSGGDDDQTSPEPQTDETPGEADSDAQPGDGSGDDATSAIGFDGPAGLSVARGAGEWLVPWGDGFLTFGFVYSGQPLPASDDGLDQLFPPEVVEAVLDSGATTIEEATDVLIEAGLYDAVVEIVDADPDLQEWLFSVPAPPPTFEMSRSSDGLEWEPVEGVRFPVGQNIHSVISDGTHLLVAGVVGADYEADDPGTLQVAITTDLASWEVHDLAGPDTTGLPDLVHAESWVGAAAIGPDGWLVTTATGYWLDEWTLLSPHVPELSGGWDVRADETGLTIDVFEPYDEVHLEDVEVDAETDGADDAAPAVVEPDDACCDVIDTIELSWDEIDIDWATWIRYREAENHSTSTWTAPWGSAPVETVVAGDVELGGVVGTDAGYVADGWRDDQGGPRSQILFSTDGREWTERTMPTAANVWLDQIFAVEGGVVVTTGDERTRAVWRAESDATGWQSVEIPGLPDDRWWGAWSFSSRPGIAAVVDLTEYPRFDEEFLHDEESATADDIEGAPGPEGPYPEPDFWLLATRDGLDWRLEDLEDPPLENSFPQHALINGDVVVVRLGDTWIRYTLD